MKLDKNKKEETHHEDQEKEVQPDSVLGQGAEVREKNSAEKHDHSPSDLGEEPSTGREGPVLAAQEQEPAEADQEPDESALLVKELRREKEELYSRLQRLQADFDNYRKRVRAERQEIQDFFLIDLVAKFLPVLDNLERAVFYVDEEASEDSLREGVKMVYRQFLDVLAREGVTPIACQGKPFDPCYHEAVAQEEAEGVPSQIVLEELQRGYQFKDKIIRASMVKVSK